MTGVDGIDMMLKLVAKGALKLMQAVPFTASDTCPFLLRLKTSSTASNGKE